MVRWHRRLLPYSPWWWFFGLLQVACDGIIARVSSEMESVHNDWPFRLPKGDMRHGTVNGYRNLNCRCPPCREAATRQHRKYIAGVRAAGKILGEHGTGTAYSSGCRCDVCKNEHNRRSREYKRQRNRDAGKTSGRG